MRRGRPRPPPAPAPPRRPPAPARAPAAPGAPRPCRAVPGRRRSTPEAHAHPPHDRRAPGAEQAGDPPRLRDHRGGSHGPGPAPGGPQGGVAGPRGHQHLAHRLHRARGDPGAQGVSDGQRDVYPGGDPPQAGDSCRHRCRDPRRADRAGHQARGPEVRGGPGEGGRASLHPGARGQARARGRLGGHVHADQPRGVRLDHLHADHQLPPGGDPRHGRDRAAAGRRRRRDRHPGDDESGAGVRPPDLRRRGGRPVPDPYQAAAGRVCARRGLPRVLIWTRRSRSGARAEDAMSAARRPEWLKVRLPSGPNFRELVGIMHTQALHTVCEEARCPNIGDCWERRTATFLILGNVCTRHCAYCAIAHGLPTELDVREPERVAEAATAMGLRHVVVTSVDRDDLADGGAAMFARTIRLLRERRPQCTVEVLIPDFKGDPAALRAVLDAGPDILNHNIETVPRLFRAVRRGGNYRRSLDLLARAKAGEGRWLTKSGMMVGLGETRDEVLETMRDLRSVGCDILTIGQYLSPGKDYAPIARYYDPEEFAEFKRDGLAMGFRHVESGPLVRSSYHADEQAVGAGAR